MQHPVKSFRLLFIFARSYWLVTGLISAICFYVYWKEGPAALQVLIYFKLITSAILMTSNYRRQFPNDVFYLNFGVSLVFLVATAAGLDLSVWIIGLVTIG